MVQRFYSPAPEHDQPVLVTITLSYGSTTIFKPFSYLDYSLKSNFC